MRQSLNSSKGTNREDNIDRRRVGMSIQRACRRRHIETRRRRFAYIPGLGAGARAGASAQRRSRARPAAARDPGIFLPVMLFWETRNASQREVRTRLRNEGKIDMNVLHAVQERLDTEEVRIIGPVELD